MRRFFLVVLGILSLSIVISQQADPSGMTDLPALDALIQGGFADTVATRTTRPGENLQRLAHVAYGTQLAWPLVWWANRNTIVDPERLETGMSIRVPRLAAGFDDPASAQALDAAYALVYRRYKALPARTLQERRWVLMQAAASGVDLGGEPWTGILDPADAAWAKGRLKVASRPGTASPAAGPEPEPAAKEVVAFSRAAVRKTFLADIVAGTPLLQEEMEAWVAAVDKSGETDTVIAALEAEAAREDAPPQVHLALALSYKRKGLISKEYAALVRTEEAASRRPEVVFNIMLLSGRKKLIESTVPASDIMVGEVRVLTEPAGARVLLDGAEVGLSPLTLPKVAVGSHQLTLSYLNHRDAMVDFDVGLAQRITMEQELERKTAILRIRSSARQQLFVDDMAQAYDTDLELPYGEHLIEIRDANYEAASETIMLAPDQVLEKTYTLASIPARWTFSSNTEGTVVELDGKVLGPLPLSDIVVEPGEHEVSFRCPGRDAIHRMVDFDANSPKLTAYWLSGVFAEPPFVVARKTIKIDGKTDDWDDVPWVAMPVFKESFYQRDPGNVVGQFKMAQDDRYIYWYMRFSDGAIGSKPIFSYSVLFPHQGQDGTFHTALKLGTGYGDIQWKPHIPSNVGRTRSDFRDLWNDQGTTSDYKVLDDVAEARFPRSALSSIVNRDFPSYVNVDTYRESFDMTHGTMQFSNIAFQPLESWTPELRLAPEGTSTLQVRGWERESKVTGTIKADQNQKNKAATAIRLDGASRLEAPMTHLLSGSHSFTMTAWVNIEKHNAAQSTILAMRQPKDLWQFAVIGKKPYFSFWDDAGDEYMVMGSTNLNERSWYSLAARFDGTSLALFVNGKKETVKVLKNGSVPVTDLSGISLATGRARPMVGAWNESGDIGGFNGRIGTLEVYHESLSDKRVLDLYSASK